MIALPTDVELVEGATAAYTRTDPFAVDLDNAVRVFLSLLPSGVTLISAEGTKNRPGWMLDFDAVPDFDIPVAHIFCAMGIADHPQIAHPQLGLVHAGFNAGALAVYPKLKTAVAGKPFALGGHSLGAALAERLAAEFILDDHPPLKVGLFAPPRVGGPQFLSVVKTVPVPAWKWGDDPVPLVPFTIPPRYDYRQVDLTKIGHFELDAFACHNIINYDLAVHAAAAGTTT